MGPCYYSSVSHDERCFTLVAQFEGVYKLYGAMRGCARVFHAWQKKKLTGAASTFCPDLILRPAQGLLLREFSKCFEVLQFSLPSFIPPVRSAIFVSSSPQLTSHVHYVVGSVTPSPPYSELQSHEKFMSAKTSRKSFVNQNSFHLVFMDTIFWIAPLICILATATALCLLLSYPIFRGASRNEEK